MILKIVLTYTAVQAINKVNGIFTGILADNAGMQAITAGDMRQAFSETGVGKFMNAHKPFGGTEKQKPQKQSVKGGDKDVKDQNKNQTKEQANGKVDKKTQEKNAKDMKMLDAAVKHGQETGRRMDGKKLSKDGKDLAVMKGTLDHMQKDGMSMKDAKAAAENDYNEQKKQSDAAADFHKKELKAGPPDRNKAQKKASKMADHDYKAMKRDLAFMKENGFHANGDEIKPGERGQMEETLKAYEGMHSGGKDIGTFGTDKEESDSGKQPEKQNNQAEGDKGGKDSEGTGNSGTTPGKQNNQAAGDKGGKDSKGTGNSGTTPGKQSNQAAGDKGGKDSKGTGNSGTTPGKQSNQTTAQSGGASDKEAQLKHLFGEGYKGSAGGKGSGSVSTGSSSGSTGSSSGSTESTPEKQNDQITAQSVGDSDKEAQLKHLFGEGYKGATGGKGSSSDSKTQE